MWLRCALVLPLAWGANACSLFGQVSVEPVATSFQKPSNVAAYVAVTDGNEPVTELQLESFRIYENQQLLPRDSIHQTLLTKELAAYHHTVLLVDMSGEQGADDARARQVGSFVETVRRTQPVTVFVFDGSPTLRYVADFAKSADGASADVSRLAKMGSSDTSRNLNGAITSGLKELDARLAQHARPVKVGTLVVFTRGPDLAGRVPESELDKALADTKDDVIAFGITGQSGSELDHIGKSGVVRAQNADAIGVGFEEAATKTRDSYDKYYLIGYCSPARNGFRRLKVEVAYRAREGKDKHGSFTTDFDATGFGPGCNVESAPRFVPQVPVKAPARKVNDTSDSSQPESSRQPATNPTAPPAEDDGPVAPPPDKPGYSH